MAANYINIPLSCLLQNSEAFYGTASNVPAYAETDIISITVPAGESYIIVGGSATGKTDTDFHLYIDGIVKETRRLAWTDRNTNFKATEKIIATESAKITCTHTSLSLHDFEATIFVTKI